MAEEIDSRVVGLELGLIAGRYLFKTEDLHYGYWPEGLELDPHNLAQAQALHSEFIVSRLPEGAKTVLDVGCGVGVLAKKLVDLGYEVDGVSPSPYFAQKCQERLGEPSRIFVCRFEDLTTSKRYDVVMFSESFQYVKPKIALPKVISLLNPGGHLVICDFFRTSAEGKSALGGGHKLDQFYRRVGLLPLESVLDLDITKETAPNLDLVNDFLQNVGRPIRDLVVRYLDANFHYTASIVNRLYRKRFEKLERKYLSGERNAANFARYKSYRFLLYRKTGEVEQFFSEAGEPFAVI